jgi:hypothetical protein
MRHLPRGLAKLTPSNPHTKQTHADKARSAVLILCLEGIKVIDRRSNQLAMAHALSRVSMCTIDTTAALFGFVAKNPGGEVKYCHVFKVSLLHELTSARGRCGATGLASTLPLTHISLAPDSRAFCTTLSAQTMQLDGET